MLQATNETYGMPIRNDVLATLRNCAIEERSITDLAGLVMGLAKQRGHSIRDSEIGRHAAVLSGPTCRIRVSTMQDTVHVDVEPQGNGPEAIVQAQALLAVLVRDLIPVLDPDDLRWLDAAARISPQDFLQITGNVAPKRIDAPARAPVQQRPRRRKRLSTIAGKAEHLLRHHFRPQPTQEELVAEFGPIAENKYAPESAPRRLSTWAITGVLAIAAPPVAATLAYLNLKKGENLRLNAQVLVMTTGLTIVISSGVLTALLTF